MKMLQKILFIPCAATILSFTACKVSSYPEDTDATANESVTNEAHTARAAISLENVDAPLDSDYIRGFDASAVDYYEQEKLINGSNAWYDTDGIKKEFFKLLKSHGVNTVRLRVWVDPSQWNASGELPDGDNSPARTLRMAKRAKEAGLKVMIDFHYSDFWADPGKQITPAAWQTLGSAEAVAQALYDHTYDVLANLNAIGATPDYVQVGNEINVGLLIQTTTSKASADADVEASGTFAYSGKSDGENFLAYIKKGCEAVRDACPDAQIIIHVASSGGADMIVEKVKDVDYDIIGLSYYPWEKDHGTTTALANRVKEYKETYEKDVVIVECGYYWNYSENSDTAITNLNYGYQHLQDSDGVYDDLEVKETESGIQYVVGSAENQAKVLRHVIEESAAAGAVGFCVWGGEIQGSLNWQYGLFDSNGEALPSIAIFGVQGTGSGSGTPAPSAFAVSASDIKATSITLSWDASENAKSYKVSYKASGESDYTVAKSGIKDTTYTLGGLTKETEYTILVTAKNGSKSTDAQAITVTTTGVSTAPGTFTISKGTAAYPTDQITVEWEASADAESYTVQYKKASDSNWTDAQTDISSAQNSYTIEELACNTAYQVKVVAKNAMGTTDSEPLTVTTDTDTTMTLTITFDGSISASTVDVTYWNANKEDRSKTVTGTVTSNTATVTSNTATVTLLKSYASDSDGGWYNAKFSIKDSSGTAIENLSLSCDNATEWGFGSGSGKYWFKFSETETIALNCKEEIDLSSYTSVVITGTESVTSTGTSIGNPIKASELASYKEKNIGKMVVSFMLENSSWPNDWWHNVYLANDWNSEKTDFTWMDNPTVDGYPYEVNFTDVFITAAFENGIYVAMNAGFTISAKVTIWYKEQ